jgi:phosphatidate cytidylyltransferase
MLYKRVLTAIPLAALVFWVIFFQPTQHFYYFLLLIVFIAGYEWAKLSGVQPTVLRYVTALVLLTVVYSVDKYIPEAIPWLLYAAVIWWFSIAYYLKAAIPKQPDGRFKPDRLVAALIVVPAAVYAMRDIHQLYQGAQWLFYAMSLVWVADIGAYFSGKRFGRTKLSPNISPGKTREGLFGAIVLTSLYSLGASFYFNLETGIAALLVLLSVIITFISVSGDLYFSFLKREAGYKDSGNILPGHGGILDRVDSTLAAMPVFFVGYQWLIDTGTITL